MKISSKCYIGRLKCGCVVSAIVADDRVLSRNSIAEDVSDWIKEGRTIELVDNDYVRKHLGPCRCNDSNQLDLAAPQTILDRKEK